MKWGGLSFLIFVSGAQALEPVKFGPEFSFYKEGTFEYEKGEAFQNRLVEHLILGQPEGSKFKLSGPDKRNGFRFESPNGWWFSWYFDGSTVEVNAKPMTIAEYKEFESDMQDAIFASAANSAHFPQLWRGGGHINIDVTNFKKNPMLFRNFVVDLLNHNELFMGIFDYNMTMAQYPHELMAGSKIYVMLMEMDELIKDGQFTFENLAELMHMRLGGRSFMFAPRKIEQGRMEIRAVRPQQSMNMWIRQISLFEGRLKYLEQFKEPLVYKPRVPWKFDRKDELTPPIPAQAAMRAFYDYVTESGQEWKDHNDYLWPQWMFIQPGAAVSELQLFEQSPWFIRRQALRSCKKWLEAAGW